MGKERVLWIDWMKVLAIYLIIAGHLSVPGDHFIYVFSVPAFFILSGLLFKSEPWSVQLSKIGWNLIVPMALLFLIDWVFSILLKIKSFDLHQALMTPVRAAIGMQGENYGRYGGLGALWFVYTLVICRVLLQGILTIGKEKRVSWALLIVINAVFLGLGILYHQKGGNRFNAIIDVLLAFPFFSIGYLLSPVRNQFPRISSGWLWASLPFWAFIVWICGRYNDTVYLYNCDYGNNLLLCLTGGVAGFFLLSGLSLLLERLLGEKRAVRILGGGTIIILGLHVILVLTYELFIRTALNPASRGFELYVVALVILLAFIPVILFCRNHLPLLFGKKRIR